MKDPEIRGLVHLPLAIPGRQPIGDAIAGCGLVRAAQARPRSAAAAVASPAARSAAPARRRPALRSVSGEIHRPLRTVPCRARVARPMPPGSLSRSWMAHPHATCRRAVGIAGLFFAVLVGRRASNHEIVALRLGSAPALPHLGQSISQVFPVPEIGSQSLNALDLGLDFIPFPRRLVAARSSGSRRRRCGNRPSGWCDWRAAGFHARAQRSIRPASSYFFAEKSRSASSRLCIRGIALRRSARLDDPVQSTPARPRSAVLDNRRARDEPLARIGPRASRELVRIRHAPGGHDCLYPDRVGGLSRGLPGGWKIGHRGRSRASPAV